MLLTLLPRSVEDLTKTFRLHESLFFNPRMAIHGSYEGRTPSNSLLERWATILIQLLQMDPLEGDMKIFAKYLLTATKGPEAQATFGSIRRVWQQEDNRSSYRGRLQEAVKKQLATFAQDCGAFRHQVDAAARKAEELEDGDFSIIERLNRASDWACKQLLELPKDLVTIPEPWQADPFWQRVQERQVLRYDPAWSLEIKDGASCFLQMLRLGVPKVQAAKLQNEEACAVKLGQLASFRAGVCACEGREVCPPQVLHRAV